MHIIRIIIVLLIASFVSYIFSKPVLATSESDTLEAYWKLDEIVQGTNAIDSSGDGLNASPFGADDGPSVSNNFAPLNFPNISSMQFDGSTQYFEVSDNDDLDKSEFTIAFWAKFENINSTHQTLVSKWQVGVKQQYTVQLTNGNVIGFWTGDGSDSSSGPLLSDLTLSEGTWYHITAIASGTDRTLYINGTENKYTGTGTSAGNSDIEFTIGSKKSNTGTYFEFFNGELDDVRFYSRALSDDEVNQLAAGNNTTAVWEGSSSSDYETSDNWDIEAVPDTFTEVEIPDADNQPIASGNITVSGLSILQDAWFDLDEYDLTINDEGDFSNEGSLILKNTQTVNNFANDTNSGTILIKGEDDQGGFATGNSYYNLILNDGLVTYLKFDEGSGTDAYDSSGYINTGVITDASYSNTRPIVNFANNKSLSFDGDSYVDIARPIVDDITICSWIRTTEVGGGGAHFDFMQIVDAEVADVNIGDFGFGINSEGSLAFGNGGDDGGDFEYVSSEVPVNDNIWHHACVTRQSSDGETNLYLDGTLVDSDTLTSGTLDASSTWRIGGFQDGGGNGKNFEGLIDDLRIYNRELTGTQIEKLADGDLPHTTIATTALNNNLIINGDLIINSGTLDVSESNYAINVAGNFENNGGIFTARSGTVTLNGSSQSINSSNTFYNLTKTVSNTDTLTFGQRSTTIVSNTLILKGSESNLLSLRSSTDDVQWKINPQGTRDLAYLNVEDSNNINSTAIAFNPTFIYGNNLTNWSKPLDPSRNRKAFNSKPRSCANSQPDGTPDLFQIDVNNTQAILYFVPASKADKYFISYGNGKNTEGYGIEFNSDVTSGVLSYSINHLTPNTEYSFKVRGGNGCMPGEWGNVMTVKTGNSAIRGASFYKNFLSRILSFFPRQVSMATNGGNVLGTNDVAECRDYTVLAGDSLWNIAVRSFGTGTKFTEIMQKNNLTSTLLRVGQTLGVGC